MENIQNYTLFPNSSELVELKAYGVINPVAQLLVKFNRTNSKDIFKEAKIKIKKTTFGKPGSKFGCYEIGIFRAADTDYRAFYKSITERFCNNTALYKKVFGCFSAWCTENNTTKIVCSLDDVMKYGYEKKEGGRRYGYETKMEFSRVVYDLCALQFYIQKEGAKNAGTFNLLQGNFFVDSGADKVPILKRLNLTYCAGIEDIFYKIDALIMPRECLKLSVKKPDTWELGEYIQTILNTEANKGRRGAMITVDKLLIFVGETNPYKRLLEKLDTLKPFFKIQYQEQPDKAKIFIWSDLLPIKEPKRKAPVKKRINV